MSFIRVEVAYNSDEEFDSIMFTARDDTEESRRDMEFLLRSICDTSLVRRGGQVPGNTIRIDVKREPEVPDTPTKPD